MISGALLEPRDAVLASLSDAARADLLATEFARDNVRGSLVSDVATAISICLPWTSNCVLPKARLPLESGSWD